MPNWEEMANQMGQPFGGIEQPQQKPQFNMQEMARGFMDTLRGIGTAMAPQNVSKTMAQPLVNMPPQGMWDFLLGKVPPEMMNAPVGEEEKKQLTQKAYDWVEPHLMATAGLTAGVNALKRPSMLSEAVEMSGKNIPTNQIWQKTGWKKDPQGKWRFEIDDSGMGLKVNEIPKGKDIYLEEIIDHPSLFEQYPELRQIKINRSSSINGYVDSNIYLKDFDKAHVIHEVQHAIQDIEGFARGGSSSKITKEMMESVGAKTPFEAYRRLYGEFDARDAVSRMNWNAEARRTVEPWSSEIKPKGGWIVRGEGGAAASTQSLMDTIRSLQPAGQGRALVSISELRDKLGMPSKEFDAQLLKLAQEGKVFLHKHDFASSLKPEERAKLLAIPNKNAHWGGNDYYIGVVPK